MPRNGTLQQDLLTRCSRFSGRYLRRFLLVTFLLMVVVAVAQVYRSQRKRSLDQVQQTFVQDVEQLGGHAVVAPASSFSSRQSLLAVDLSGATINGQMIRRLSEFPTIERLNLEGANLTSQDFGAIGQLTQLRRLSLDGTTFSENDFSLDGLQLTTLSLRDASITDRGLSRLAGMSSLTNLDISRTAVTAEGLNSLRPLLSLKMLTVDDSCITQDSVPVLRSMKSLKTIRIHVAEGLGRHTRELVDPLTESVSVTGLHPRGPLLWNAEQLWQETLAGVVEAVAQEVDLEPQQVAQLIEVIGTTGLPQSQPMNFNSTRTQPEKSGKDIVSVEEFLRLLHNPGSPSYEVRAFACNRFTKNDVPKLLDALRGLTNFRDAENLARCGAYLLVRDGQENPEATQQLDRMLRHEDRWVRITAAYAFNRYGHPFGDDWSPSAKAVEFGLPALLRLCEDPDNMIRLSVPEVLGDIVHHHPGRASEVMPVLIRLLEQGNGGYVNHAIRRIVEVNPDAGKACIPVIRRMLQDIDNGTSVAQLNRTPNEPDYRPFIVEAMFDMARGDPDALDYLHLIRNGEAHEKWLATLVSRQHIEAVRIIVRELLAMSASDDRKVADYSQRALARVAIAIRDLQTAMPER